MDNIAIQFCNVSKKYDKYYGVHRLGRAVRKLKRVIRYPWRDYKMQSEVSPNGEFWALKDVSFKVKKGECLGIIGHNGAGKTTTLKILSGITTPSSGKIMISGSIATLIDVQAGFHPDLTGRENVYLQGAILGMRRSEITKKFDEIVDFSELRDFIDVPVKRYSAGMKVRLGFSVAINVDPDILLVDEVLAVGDLSFQAKSVDIMMKLIKSDKTLLFVSHSPARIEAVSDRVLWLDHGQIRQIGESGKVCAQYVLSQSRKISRDKKESPGNTHLTIINIERVVCIDAYGVEKDVLFWGEPITFRIYYQANQHIIEPYFQLEIRRSKGARVSTLSMLRDGAHPVKLEEGKGFVDCLVKYLPLSPGVYDLVVSVRGCQGAAFLTNEGKYGEFRVELSDDSKFTGPMASSLLASGGPMLLPYQWSWNN